jgi:hypothetical protein
MCRWDQLIHAHVNIKRKCINQENKNRSRCALTKGVGSDVPRASIQAWTSLIVFANTFCRSACEMFLM